MKKLFLIVPLLFLVTIAVTSFRYADNSVEPDGDEMNLGFPEEVTILLEVSCFDCHTADSKNTKAKSKLNFSKWANYSDSKKVGKLDKICEEIKEGKMPTKKYLEYYPEKKLTEEQVKLICDWVDQEASKLMGE